MKEMERKPLGSIEEGFKRVFRGEGSKMLAYYQNVFDHKDDYAIPEGVDVSGHDTFEMVCRNNAIIPPVTREGFLNQVISFQDKPKETPGATVDKKGEDLLE